ncbi:MAG: M24 family metallopeptidase [Lentisphaeria bacterium]|nr:M24 family metallopeptidase [Lentisphaeria bacterium]
MIKPLKTADLIIAAGTDAADLRYVSGFAAPDSFLWFRCGGECAIVVSQLEYSRALASVKPGVNVLLLENLGARSWVDAALTIARSRGIGTFRVPADFPLALAERLRGGCVGVVAQMGTFCPERQFKSQTEKDAIIRALRVTEQGMRRAVEVIGAASVGNDGVLRYDGEILTSERLRFEIDSRLLRLGAVAVDTIAAAGVQSAAPHQVGSGPIRAGVPIVIDIFPRMNDSGYWGDLTRTVAKQEMAPVVAAAYDAVKRARDLTEPMMVPGAIPADIHCRAQQILTEAGFPTGRDQNGAYGFFHSLGHGVGLEIHEDPRISPGNRQPLRGGEVITDEPGVYYPAWGGVRLENMIYVGQNGAERLTVIEDDPVIP